MYRKHHPFHFYRDDTIYFVTARIIEKIKFFSTREKKEILRGTLKDVLKRYGYKLYAWVILDNHYHLLIKANKGDDLKFFVRDLHSLSAKRLNELENQAGRKIWFQYWDRCIRDEKDFFKHFNYIHHNLVKHGYFKWQEEILGSPFCSYRQWADKNGEEWLSSCFERHPIRDFTVEE